MRQDHRRLDSPGTEPPGGGQAASSIVASPGKDEDTLIRERAAEYMLDESCELKPSIFHHLDDLDTEFPDH